MSGHSTHCSRDKNFIAILLKQAEEIFNHMCHDGVLRMTQYLGVGIKVIDTEQFGELIEKSRALVTYTDCFVLRDPSDKRSDIWAIVELEHYEDPYHALCYVTGILDTLISTLPKRTIPQNLKTGRQQRAFNVMYGTRLHLNYYVSELEQKR